jgi:hypothetical protein
MIQSIILLLSFCLLAACEDEQGVSTATDTASFMMDLNPDPVDPAMDTPVIFADWDASPGFHTPYGDRNAKGAHLLFLTEGFQLNELDHIKTQVEYYITYFLSHHEIKRRRSYWNFHVYSTASVDSGIPEDTPHNTTYQSFLSSGGGHIEVDHSLIVSTRFQECPECVSTMVIHNVTGTRAYAMFPFRFAVLDSNSLPLTVLHELGHSFAYLYDEYEEDDKCTTSNIIDNANIWHQDSLYPVQWQRYMTPQLPTDNVHKIGLFEGGFYCSHTYYRPTKTSIMRSHYVDDQFRTVNYSVWDHQLKLTTGIVDQCNLDETLTHEVTIGSVTISCQPLYPRGSFNYRWFIKKKDIPADEVYQSGYEANTTFHFSKAGEYTISLKPYDLSQWAFKNSRYGIFTESPSSYRKSWTFKVIGN